MPGSSRADAPWRSPRILPCVIPCCGPTVAEPVRCTGQRRFRSVAKHVDYPGDQPWQSFVTGWIAP
jgi:hypothetical protein